MVNQRIGGQLSVYWSINERFRCKIKLSTLLRLEWSSLISFLEDINDRRSNFVEKDNLSPYKMFLWKEGWSFQTWEDGNNWQASKTPFSWIVLQFSAKRHVSCHVTCQKYQFYFKMLRTLKANYVLNLVPLPFIPSKI